QAEIELGGVLHPEIVQRLCCDGRIQTVLEDKDGNAVGIGHASRKVPRWLRRQLRKRDRTCTFPGCERRWFLQAHHIRWWTQGGRTDLDNLALTCHHHHRLVHEGRWGVSLEKTGVAWYRPNGKRYEPGVKQMELVERAPPEEASA
ncbi:MAG: HNH endonuclease, partial [Actinomycetota bacterium]|nr:HNH endonuclease [Actinomycetota bacterium]